MQQQQHCVKRAQGPQQETPAVNEKSVDSWDLQNFSSALSAGWALGGAKVSLHANKITVVCSFTKSSQKSSSTLKLHFSIRSTPAKKTKNKKTFYSCRWAGYWIYCGKNQPRLLCVRGIQAVCDAAPPLFIRRIFSFKPRTQKRHSLSFIRQARGPCDGQVCPS